MLVLTVTKEKEYAPIWELNDMDLSLSERSIYHDTILLSVAC